MRGVANCRVGRVVALCALIAGSLQAQHASIADPMSCHAGSREASVSSFRGTVALQGPTCIRSYFVASTDE
jgi:hypothetical protein